VENRSPIRSFRDLEVYQLSFKASIIVAKQIVPKLPFKDPFDTRDQVARSSAAVPRLIAEGYAKRHQKLGFQRYLDDANCESNETQVTLCQIKEIYGHLIDKELVERLIDVYDKTSRQIYNLGSAWNNFKTKSRSTRPPDESSFETPAETA